MASRMDKYYDRRFQDTKRSKRNRLLYEEIDLEVAIEKLYDEVILPLNEVAKKGIQNKNKNYDFDKAEQKQLLLDEDKSNLNIPTNINDYLKIMDDYVKIQNIQQKNVKKIKLHKEQDEKIKELIAIITNTSNLNKSNHKKVKLNKNDYSYPIDITISQEKSKVSILLDKIKNLFRKKQENVKVDKNLTQKESLEKTEAKRLNLKVKFIVGIIFLVNSIIIISIIYFALK